MAVIDCINIEFADKTIKRCSEKGTGCKLKLNTSYEHVILKGEKICSDRKICDCIIFVNQNDTIIVGIVELKSKHIDASAIEEQLTNGSKIALKILKKCPDTYNESNFYPIVLAKGWGRASKHAVMKNIKIQFGSERRRIITKKCGDSFLEIISQLK
jgi:hypothetical protein